MRQLFTLLILVFLTAPCPAAEWGVTADFANLSRAQSEYESEVLTRKGVNCVFLNVRGTDFNWPNWVGVEETWNKAGVNCIWDLPTTLTEYERILGFSPGTFTDDDRAVLEDNTHAYFSGRSKLGNLFNGNFIFQTERISKAVARRLRTASGLQFTADINLVNGSYDADALASWQLFLKKFFQDNSPSEDDNVDSCTFNSTFSTGYGEWSQVPLFTSRELSDRGKRLLVNLWLADSYAAFVDDVGNQVHTDVNHKLRFGLGIDSASPGAVDASVLLSRKDIDRIYTDSPDALPALSCAAATFNKSIFMRDIKLTPGDYAASLQRALKVLPYAGGATFNYGELVKERKPGDPAEIAAFDPAFRVIPTLAPFAGKFRTKRTSLLWILPDGANTSDIIDAYGISESALALDPKCIDFNQFKAVIYRTSSPCISLEIMQRLFEYALNGGTVFVDAYDIGSGPTLYGRENAHFWWLGMKPGRQTIAAGSSTISYNNSTWTIPNLTPYLALSEGKFDRSGSVKNSAGATYPLLLIRKLGKSGKWVFINAPSIWDSHPDLLRTIVRNESGVDIPDPSQPRVYQGEGCVLVIGGKEIKTISIPCSWEKAAVFDVSGHEASVIQSANGRITLPDNIQPDSAELWIVKPYGQPIVLYTNGAIDTAASITDGKFADKSLTFKFAEYAWISSPTRPKSLTIDGKDATFTYDESRHLVTVERKGDPVEAKLEYE